MSDFFKNSQDYYHVGKVKDAHGIKGELYLLLFAKGADWLDDLDFVRLEKENPTSEADKLELPIQSLRKHKAGLILKTPQLKDRNEAEALKGYAFYIPSEMLASDEGDRPFLIELKDFAVVDHEEQHLGDVTGFSSNGAQDLLVVKNAKGEFEVPYVDAYILDVDYEGKKIKMDLPEGLIERA